MTDEVPERNTDWGKVPINRTYGYNAGNAMPEGTIISFDSYGPPPKGWAGPPSAYLHRRDRVRRRLELLVEKVGRWIGPSRP